MHELTHRQLPALVLAALLTALPAGTRAESAAGEELRTVKVTEAAVMARGAKSSELKEVRRTYERLEAKYPASAAIKNAHAEFLWTIEDRDAAVKKWEAAATLDPKNAVVLDHLGGAFLASGEVQRAADFFRRASEVEPTNPAHHFNAANVIFIYRHDMGITEEQAFAQATHHFAEASRLAPASAEYARAYAEVFYTVTSPDWKAALAAWERFRALSPNQDFAFANLARVHMKLGQKGAAQACLNRIQGADFQRLKERLQKRLETE